METTTVKELKDMIDRGEYELTGGFPVGVRIGDFRCAGFARDGHAEDWVYQLRFGLDRYDDDHAIPYNDEGNRFIRVAVMHGKYRV